MWGFSLDSMQVHVMTQLFSARAHYPTDIDDVTWVRVEPVIPAARSNRVVGGRTRETDMREVVNAIRYRERLACPWRMLPHDFPHWQIVRHYQTTWQREGVLDRIRSVL